MWRIAYRLERRVNLSQNSSLVPKLERTRLALRPQCLTFVSSMGQWRYTTMGTIRKYHRVNKAGLRIEFSSKMYCERSCYPSHVSVVRNLVFLSNEAVSSRNNVGAGVASRPVWRAKSKELRFWNNLNLLTCIYSLLIWSKSCS